LQCSIESCVGRAHAHAVGTTRTQINTAMQAVDVLVEVDGKPVRAIIPREVFEGRLRSKAGPDAWLESYRNNAAMIEAVIRKRLVARDQDFVVVRSSDFGPRRDA